MNTFENVWQPVQTKFDKFVETCYTSHTPGQNVTVDEMLIFLEVVKKPAKHLQIFTFIT